eukprot:TRINITY_DN1395_c0_g1_i2.p1 TRINITY_DN1395_c0_g1~~TRINITY_DN1395_c0_g1_i2.p1  ORF type:complete len:175 (-),score=82.46 TRINITY_DN1395_c0_g1_i2:13-537(-)
MCIRDRVSTQSTWVLRFCENVLNENFLPTIGVDFKIKTFEINKKSVKMQIWDTAGQEKFKTITASYYKGAHGVILVYDITSKQSFQDLTNWLHEIEKHASDQVNKILIGNKCDLQDKREVTMQEAEEFAKQNDMTYLETSAKTSENVQKAFYTCLLYTSPSPRDKRQSRMPSSA